MGRGWEWGIVHCLAPDRLYRGPLTFAEAMDWLVEWEQDGGSLRVFLLACRKAGDEAGDWTPISEELK